MRRDRTCRLCCFGASFNVLAFGSLGGTAGGRRPEARGWSAANAPHELVSLLAPPGGAVLFLEPDVAACLEQAAVTGCLYFVPFPTVGFDPRTMCELPFRRQAYLNRDDVRAAIHASSCPIQFKECTDPPFIHLSK